MSDSEEGRHRIYDGYVLVEERKAGSTIWSLSDATERLSAATEGGFAMLYFTSFDGPWKLKAGDDASLVSKGMAVVVLGSWAAVIVFGRLLPYYGGGG